MGWSLNSLGSKLLLCFNKHGSIALHDPLWHILVPLPRGIGDHFPAVFLRVNRRLAHCVIIISIHHDHPSTLALDAADAVLRSERVHVDHGRKAHLAGCPRHAGAVIAIGGGGKGWVSELFAPSTFQVQQITQGHFFVAEASALQELLVNGISTTKHLEGV